MEAEGNPTDFSSLLQAIKSSNDLEHQASLINRLVESHEPESDGIYLIVECLPTLWMDASGTRECILNKAVLSLSIKYFESRKSCCPSHFVLLCTKACSWSFKYLESFLSTEELLIDIFFQIVMDSLKFSSIICTALASSVLEEKLLELIVENFVLEQMNLMKILIAEIKRFHSTLSPILKVVHTNLDALIKLSRSYLEALKCGSTAVDSLCGHDQTDRAIPDHSRHVIGVTVCMVQNLHDLGTIAASGGGNLVALLNTSWKGVVSLLQLGKGVLCDKINVGDILMTLMTLALDALKLTTVTWNQALTDNLSSSEAKRSILPVKFFLINAVRIYSEYSCQTLKVYGMAAKCALVISCLAISFCKEDNLKAAGEALAEILEPTYLLLFCSILTSSDVKHDDKLHLLDNLFSEDNKSCYASFNKEINFLIQDATSTGHQVDDECIFDAATLMLGKMLLFLNVLKSSMHLKEEILFALSRKLELSLTWLINEDVYASILCLYVPLSACGKTTGTVWQPIVPYMLHCLRTFMIVSTSSQLAWSEVEYFLLENLFHPHVLCVEVVMELWRFLVRNAKPDIVQDILDGLHLLLKTVAISDPVLTPFSDLRRIARLVAIIASCAPKTCIDRVYSTFVSGSTSKLSSIMHIAILMEGYPLDLLSESVRRHSFQKIQKSFVEFLGNNPRELGLLSSSRSNFTAFLGLPAHALLCVLQHCQINRAEVLDNKIASQFLRFVVSVIREFSNTLGSLKDSHYAFLGTLLDIISNLKTLYTSKEMGGVVLELQTLFHSESASSTRAISHHCNASLLAFMAGLSHMDIEETDSNSVCCAMWALYHALLKERHWASIHLALVSFGYFTARTSCCELWRFVPHDAALSFDIETGDVACEERFMAEFKAFLEKEVPSDVMASFKVQFDLLKREGFVLKNKVLEALSYKAEIPDSNVTKADDGKRITSKKRKMPGGVNEGLAMLKSGLKTLNDAFAHEDSSELKEEFSTHLSCLEDVVSHMFSLSNKDRVI